MIDLVASERYDEALAIADSLSTNYPDSPEGYFIRATALNGRSIDYEDELDNEALAEACQQVQTICEGLLEKGDAAHLRFYLGTILGYRSFQSYRSGDWVNAYMQGVRAAKHLEAALEIDSTCRDACLGLGSFYYYRSSRAGLLRRVGIISDRREQGLELIRLAARRGRFSFIAARSALTWISIEMEELDSAITQARRLLERYPGSRASLWCLGSALMKAEKWEEAAQTYEQLLTSIRRESRNNHYNEVGCLHALARGYAEMGRWQMVVRFSGEALDLKLDPGVARSKSSDISRLKLLRKRGLKKIAKGSETIPITDRPDKKED